MNVALAVAVIATVVLSYVPGLGVLTYPLTLFDTTIHEMCHAVASWLTGGSVHSISIFQDTSGVTMVSGGFHVVTASAGYVGTTVTGLLMVLATGGRGTRLIGGCLMAVGAVMFFLVSFFSPIGLACALALVGIGFLLLTKLPQHVADLIVAFLGMQLIVNSFYDLGGLFRMSVSSQTFTDALIMQSMTGIPAVMWALLWMGLSGAAVIFSVIYLSKR